MDPFLTKVVTSPPHNSVTSHDPVVRKTTTMKVLPPTEGRKATQTLQVKTTIKIIFVLKLEFHEVKN